MFGLKRKKQDLSTLPFIEVEGEKGQQELTLLALSTCGFCKKAIEFLSSHNLAFRYLFVDKMSRSEKDEIRNFVRTHYNSRLSYPFLLIGSNNYLVGFIRVAWEKELLDE